MKRVKKVVVMMVAVLITVSLAFSAYADTSTIKFTDIDGRWTTEYIKSVSAKGLMDGISDTKFMPLQNLKGYEALISIARMMHASEVSDLTTLEAKYKEKVLDKYKVPANARKAVAFCLEKGIIMEADVSVFSNKTDVTKQMLCVFLGRAFGVTINDTNKPKLLMPFTDSSIIYGPYTHYIDKLINKGVIDAKGDVKGNFNPSQVITREVFAKMIDVASDSYEKDIKGNTDSTSITTGGTTGTTTTTPNSTDSNIVPAATTLKPTVTGVISQIIPEYGNIIVEVKGVNNITTKNTYNIPDNVVCIVDGIAGYYWKLKKDDIIDIYLTNNKVTKISVESKIKKYTGVLQDIEITDKTVVVIKTDNGEIKRFNIIATTTITKEGKAINYKELKNGNTISATTSYEDLIQINMDSSKSTDKGIIESITYSRTAPTKFIITKADGKQSEYYISTHIHNEDINVLGKTADINAVHPGMTVELSIENEEVTGITATVALNYVKIEGTIKYEVNKVAQVLTIEVMDSATNKYVDKLVFVSSAKIRDIMDNALTISQLKKGQSISIYGTEDMNGITALMILIQN